MNNKVTINRLKENAELAMAAYGYFHLANPKYDFNKDNTDKKRLEYFRELKDDKTQSLFPTPTDILNIEYKYFRDENDKPQDSWYHKHFLDGDMTPTQAKRFFERYDMLIHQPNTKSGFSATLFGAKRKQTNTESKEVSYTNDYGYTNYILAFRGTEPSNIGDIKADVNLTFKNLPKKQYFDMLLFYNQCIGKIPFYVDSTSMPQDKDSLEYKLWKKLYQRSTESKYKPYIIKSLLQDSNLPPTSSNFTPPIYSTTKLTLTGHSLGGALTQMFALSFANYAKRDCGILNEVYHTESKVA